MRKCSSAKFSTLMPCFRRNLPSIRWKRKTRTAEDGEISEETAGPTIRDDDEVEDEDDIDGEDGDGEKKKDDDDEEEDNTLSLAQMEAALKPEALETFARITSLFKKVREASG